MDTGSALKKSETHIYRDLPPRSARVGGWNTPDYWKMRAAIEDRATLYAIITQYREALGIFKTMVTVIACLLVFTGMIIVWLVIRDSFNPNDNVQTQPVLGKVVSDSQSEGVLGHVLYMPNGSTGLPEN